MSIEENLQKIQEAIYGRDVRDAIHDAIHDCYEDGKSGAVDLIARERIDTILDLPEGSTVSNARLEDICVKEDGTKATSPGAAVREQIAEVKGEITKTNNEVTDLKSDLKNIPLPIKRTNIFNGNYERFSKKDWIRGAIDLIMKGSDDYDIVKAKIDGGKYYVVSKFDSSLYPNDVRFADKNNQFISGLTVFNENVLVPENAYYVYYKIPTGGTPAVGEADVFPYHDDYDYATNESIAMPKLKAEISNELEEISPSKIMGVTTVGNYIPYFLSETKEGVFVQGNVGNDVVFSNNAAYITYKIKANNVKYYFSGTRFVRAVDENEKVVYSSNNIAVGEADLSLYPTAKYLYVSITDTPEPYISVTENNKSQSAVINWLKTEKQYSQFAEMNGNVVNANTEQYIEFVNSNKTGFEIAFSGDFSNFANLEIGMLQGNDKAYISITKENVIIYNAYGTSETKNHGLNIVNNIGVNISCNTDASCNVLITSNGETFSFETNKLVTVSLWKPYVKSRTEIKNAKFTSTNNKLNKNVWMFGDSYFGFDTVRWMYYFVNGLYAENALLDAYSGERGTYAIQSFSNMCKIGKAKYAVWCLGMNDGGDGEGPSELWMGSVSSFISKCLENGITPILATIPSVPNINHEKKNEWVRNSGYQYIDFAKAVGATSNGTWYEGMLSGDNVHPSEKGAKALYARFLSDFPQIKITN